MWSRLVKTLLFISLTFIYLSGLDFGVAQGQDSSSIELAAEAGFEGFYKSDYWVPINITIENRGSATEGTLQIAVDGSFGGGEVVYSSPISLPTQSNKRLAQYVHLSDLANRLRVDLVDQQERILRTSETNALDWLEAGDILYGVVSSTSGELDHLEGLTGDRSHAAVAFMDLEELPELPSAWNALDVIILHNVDTGRLKASQLEALMGWIDLGGQLVVTGGPGWQKTVAGVADYLPVAATGTESLDDLPGLRAAADEPYRDPGPYLVTTSSLRGGEIVFAEDGLILLAKKDFGRGSVYFLALDPDLAPLADWDGSEVIWNEIVSNIPPLSAWASGPKNGYAANSAISTLPALQLPSAGLLFLFLFIYILAIGPLNYLILKRVDRKQLAWLTVPGLALAFTLIALITGFRLKGNDVVINQMSIVFGHIDGQRMRAHTLLGLYSPGRSTYDMTLPGEVAIRPFDPNFGSLSSGGKQEAVERDRDVKVQGIRVDVGDVQPFVADSYQPAPSVDGNIVIRSEGENFILDITIENNSPETLANSTVLIGLNAISLGDIKPGDVVFLSEPFSTALSPSFGGGYSTSLVPAGPGTTPLGLNYSIILGSAAYYDDPETYAKWQLLEALGSDISAPRGEASSGTATLIAWSEEEQLDVTLENSEFESMATTVYFFELPLEQTVVEGQDLSIPKALLSWRVLGENGVFDAAIDDLYLPPGWIEFEYRPWSDLQSIKVGKLDIILQQPVDSNPQQLPRTQLWDWQQELWVTLDGISWGQNRVSNPESYIGPGRAIRIRLQNDGPEGIVISEVYPNLTGEIDPQD